MYKIIKAQTPEQTDGNKVIEKTSMVEKKEIFTISQIKREIEMIDRQIANFQQRKAELEAKIAEAIRELDLKLIK